MKSENQLEFIKKNTIFQCAIFFAKAENIQKELEENFFTNQPASLRRTVDFLAERLASNFIKLIRKMGRSPSIMLRENAEFKGLHCDIVVDFMVGKVNFFVLSYFLCRGALGLMSNTALRDQNEKCAETSWFQRNGIGASSFSPKTPTYLKRN